MRLAVMQPYFFPYIGYFQLINFVDKFVIYDDVNFINRGWINRNNILVNERACLFTVPLSNASQNKLIMEVAVSGSEWKAKFLRTIEMAYKKAPQFEATYALVKTVVETDTLLINELAYRSLRAVSEYLALPTVFERTSAVYDNKHLKAQHRILDICIREKAVHYINPIGGQEIYSRELFNGSGIELNFIKARPLSYEQFGKEFVPGLSMIDVLMFNSKDKIRELLNLYELV